MKTAGTVPSEGRNFRPKVFVLATTAPPPYAEVGGWV